MKWQKKGLVGLLANPFILVALIILILIFAFSFSGGLGLNILNPSVSFAGRSWSIEEPTATTTSSEGFTFKTYPNGIRCIKAGSVSFEKTTDFLVLRSSASGGSNLGRVCAEDIYALIDVTNDDEILVLLDGYGIANAGGSGASGGYNMYASVMDSNGDELWQGKGISADARTMPSASGTFEPQIFSFKNNFDGTWSSIESFGIGDVFIKKETKTMIPPIKLKLGSVSTLSLADGSASASGFSRFYNVVFKENGFAVCKADEVLVGEVCQNLQNILLKNEEAIKESYDEKFARIEAELLAKNQGLTTEITALKEQLAQQGISTSQITLLQQQISQLEAQLATATDKTAIQAQIDALKAQQSTSPDINDRLSALEAELKLTKQQLADVQVGDKTVVNVIEHNEAIQKPNIIKGFFNRLFAWIKNLFS